MQIIQPPSVLLMGGIGSGKTYAISTLLEAGLKVFVIITEPTGLDTLLDVVHSKRLDVSNLHWRAITPARASFKGLIDIANKVSVMDFEALSKLRPSGNRRDAQWISVLHQLDKFKSDKDDKDYGDITSFGPDCAVVLDSLSGLNLMAMDLVIGDKPNAHQGEWGTAMGMLEKLLLTLCSSLKCTFVLTSHLEREVNEITGGSTIGASALGRKLGPKIPRFFSETVMAYRDGDKFYWSTTAVGVDLKNRALPLSNKLEPTFRPVVEAYRRRLTQLEPKEVKPTAA